MFPTIPTSPPMPLPASARLATGIRRSLLAQFTLLTLLISVFLQPTFVVAQAPAQQCVEIDFDADLRLPTNVLNLCKGIGKVHIPSPFPAEFVAPFLVGADRNIATRAEELRTNPTHERINDLLNRVIFTPVGLSGWGRKFANCEVKGLQGRWFRALTCSAIVQLGNRLCQRVQSSPRPLLCPKDIKEAFATWKQAFGHPSNSCTPDWVTTFASSVSNSANLNFSKAESCFPGSQVENAQTCGFPNLAQACANSCRSQPFLDKMATDFPGPIEQACKRAMGSSLNFDPVPALTEADFAGPSGRSPSPTGDSGSPDVASSGSPVKPDGAFPPTATDTTTPGFMERPIAGIAGKFWVAGAGGIVGVAVILVGVLMIRRRTAASMAAKARNMRSEESGGAPRDGFAEKPPALALGTLTASRVPQQGPLSPTNEYGVYNNNGQNDRKDFFPPSPPHEHFRHPRSPSPPPPHAAHAQGGWSGPHQDAYGSVAPPPPPPAKQFGMGRPDTWTKIAQRDSTRPPSMMPRDPVYPRAAILSYMPRLEDELEVHVGDQVAVWEDYADGYAWGETMDGRQGVFPIMCLADPNGPPRPQQHMHQQGPQQGAGGEPLRDMQEGGVRETMVNPQAYRFTQYTVASDVSDDVVAEYRGQQQQPPMPQQTYQQQQPSQQHQYAQQPQPQHYGKQQGQGQQRW